MPPTKTEKTPAKVLLTIVRLTTQIEELSKENRKLKENTRKLNSQVSHYKGIAEGFERERQRFITSNHFLRKKAKERNDSKHS